jgi:hypothetical protein
MPHDASTRPASTVVTLATGKRLRIVETRSEPHYADLERYFKEYATGLISENAHYAFDWLSRPQRGLVEGLTRHIMCMNIMKQAIFVNAFHHVLESHLCCDGTTIDFDSLPKEAVWAMMYHCTPKVVREFL